MPQGLHSHHLMMCLSSLLPHSLGIGHKLERPSLDLVQSLPRDQSGDFPLGIVVVVAGIVGLD